MSKEFKYSEMFQLSAGGSFTFSVRGNDLAALSRVSEAEIEGTVRNSANTLLSRTKAAAPYRFGHLRAGLIVAPGREKSKTYGKVVNDIVFDAAMNDVFVKMSKAGKRYYYPASQEYGFRVEGGKRVPGLYYMRNTASAFYAVHEETIVEKTIDILEAL